MALTDQIEALAEAIRNKFNSVTIQLENKQPTTTFKTINGESIVGEGNLVIEGGSGGGVWMNWRGPYAAATAYQIGDGVQAADPDGIASGSDRGQTFILRAAEDFTSGDNPLVDYSQGKFELIAQIPWGKDAEVVSFATDAEALAYSTANPKAAVFSREGA